jgi:hypothetical protein
MHGKPENDALTIISCCGSALVFSVAPGQAFLVNADPDRDQPTKINADPDF